ncbi:MAG: nuclear transport factor 2 family protein [Beijerinckiaceae bacterium]
MKRKLIWAFAAVLCVAPLGGAAADPKEEAIALYQRFAAAQNAHDLHAVRQLLTNEPDFLWVSDGMPVWGAGATLERMATFQKSAVWRVEPDLGRARPIALSDDVAILHIPLTLVIGGQDRPDRLRFLVGMVARKGDQGWRIAALFTTPEKETR